MRIAVIGAGLSGCTIARLLKDRGHEVVILKKNKNQVVCVELLSMREGFTNYLAPTISIPRAKR